MEHINTKKYNTENKKKDMVNHPDHYKTEAGLETIDVIKAFTQGLDGIEATDTGNIIKYACRWKKKNGIEDLEKIVWYTNHLINHLKEQEKKTGESEPKPNTDVYCKEPFIPMHISDCIDYMRKVSDLVGVIIEHKIKGDKITIIIRDGAWKSVKTWRFDDVNIKTINTEMCNLIRLSRSM